MGIFTGIEILFFVLGVIAASSVFGLIYLNKKYILKWYSHTLAGIGIFLVLFTIAWAVSSVLEGEPQAANMGLIVFGFPILIIFGVTSRLIKKDSAKAEN